LRSREARKPISENCTCGSSSELRSRAAWFSGLERAILALDQHPDRCPIAPESINPDHVRVLSYGRRPHVYRIFFTVDHSAKVVRVVHVRRGARQRPTADELKG
jgi:toxin ParE1/3/4